MEVRSEGHVAALGKPTNHDVLDPNVLFFHVNDLADSRNRFFNLVLIVVPEVGFEFLGANERFNVIPTVLLLAPHHSYLSQGRCGEDNFVAWWNNLQVLCK